MSEDPRLAKLRELERELRPRKVTARALSESLAKQSDRGCAIIGTSFLEDQLELLLRAICRNDEESVKQAVDPLFDSYAPFATFSAKFQAAFALRLMVVERTPVFLARADIRNPSPRGFS